MAVRSSLFLARRRATRRERTWRCSREATGTWWRHAGELKVRRGQRARCAGRRERKSSRGRERQAAGRHRSIGTAWEGGHGRHSATTWTGSCCRKLVRRVLWTIFHRSGRGETYEESYPEGMGARRRACRERAAVHLQGRGRAAGRPGPAGSVAAWGCCALGLRRRRTR